MYMQTFRTQLRIHSLLPRDLERPSLPNAVTTSPPSLPPPLKRGDGWDQTGKPQALTANSVRERAQQSLDETNKQLKAINVSVWLIKIFCGVMFFVDGLLNECVCYLLVYTYIPASICIMYMYM